MNFFHYFLIFMLLIAPGNWGYELDTAKNSDYMSQKEKEIMLEINKARSNPTLYAEEYLEKLRPFYDGKRYIRPGQPVIITSEGKKALDECICFLKKARPVRPLNPEKGLYLAAYDHMKDQRENGGTGHFGSDGSKPFDRMERYGTWDICAAENISYGIDDPRMIVISLLIDDGVSDRSHRNNILNPQFTVAGISYGSHPSYGSTCVMDFAGAFNPK